MVLMSWHGPAVGAETSTIGIRQQFFHSFLLMSVDRSSIFAHSLFACFAYFLRFVTDFYISESKIRIFAKTEILK